MSPTDKKYLFQGTLILLAFSYGLYRDWRFRRKYGK